MDYITSNDLWDYVYNNKLVMTIESSAYQDYINTLRELGIPFEIFNGDDDTIEFDINYTDKIMEIVTCPVTF